MDERVYGYGAQQKSFYSRRDALSSSVNTSLTPSQNRSQSPNNENWEMEKFVGQHEKDGKVQYIVRWVNSWLDKAHLSCNNLIAK